jgi:MprA protease rhombosortase-interaction domain-containing protein
MLHFIGLAMGVGTSFAMLTLGSTARRLPPEESRIFFGRVGGLAKNGSIGFLLLVASGVGMLLDRGVSVMFQIGGGAFHVKLTLVLILAGLLGYSQVLRKRLREGGGAGPAAGTLPKVGMAMLALGVGIIVTAVMAFH